LEKELIVLAQYAACENKKQSEAADRVIRLLLWRFPFLFQSQRVLAALESVIDGLFGVLNKKFSADPLTINVAAFDQGLIYPSSARESNQRLSVVLELTFLLFLASRAQNSFLTRKALLIFLNQKTLNEFDPSASISFFMFMDKTEELAKSDPKRVNEIEYLAMQTSPSALEDAVSRMSGLTRIGRLAPERHLPATGQPDQFPAGDHQQDRPAGAGADEHQHQLRGVRVHRGQRADQPAQVLPQLRGAEVPHQVQEQGPLRRPAPGPQERPPDAQRPAGHPKNPGLGRHGPGQDPDAPAQAEVAAADQAALQLLPAHGQPALLPAEQPADAGQGLPPLLHLLDCGRVLLPGPLHRRLPDPQHPELPARHRRAEHQSVHRGQPLLQPNSRRKPHLFRQKELEAGRRQGRHPLFRTRPDQRVLDQTGRKTAVDPGKRQF
jgi:hypothetical protein